MSNYQIAKGPIPYVGLHLDYYVIIGFFGMAMEYQRILFQL